MKIAFIGLGNMGGPMALNLLKAGHEIQAFDLSKPACDKLAADGVAIAASANAAVQGAEAIITMLPASQHVEALFLGSNGQSGLLAHIAKGALVIDSSTIAAATSQKVAQAAQAQGVDFIDAPVSGGTGGAIAGTLTFMVGGTAPALERARPLLEKMGANIFHAGAVGAGQTAKICNNMLLGASMIATSEAFLLAEQLGLDPQKFFDISSVSSGQNWSMTSYCPLPGVGPETPADHDYQGGFAVALMLKDLKLAMEAAQDAGAETPMGARAAELYQAYADQGQGGADFSGIIRMLAAKD